VKLNLVGQGTHDELCGRSFGTGQEDSSAGSDVVLPSPRVYYRNTSNFG
jgi:hypothetical protein